MTNDMIGHNNPRTFDDVMKDVNALADKAAAGALSRSALVLQVVRDAKLSLLDTIKRPHPKFPKPVDHATIIYTSYVDRQSKKLEHKASTVAVKVSNLNSCIEMGRTIGIDGVEVLNIAEKEHKALSVAASAPDYEGPKVLPAFEAFCAVARAQNDSTTQLTAEAIRNAMLKNPAKEKTKADHLKAASAALEKVVKLDGDPMAQELMQQVDALLSLVVLREEAAAAAEKKAAAEALLAKRTFTR